jgi:hypothetical protein
VKEKQGAQNDDVDVLMFCLRCNEKGDFAALSCDYKITFNA